MAAIEGAAGKKGMRPLRRALGVMHALAGWLLIYLVIGGALGFAFWQPLTDEPSCLPRITVFLVFTTNCTVQIVNTFWFLVVEVPRGAIVILAMPLAIVSAAVKGIVFAAGKFAAGQKAFAYAYLWNAVPWLRVAVPLLLLILAGAAYWWKRTRAVALVAPTAFVAAAVYLARLE